MIAKILLFLALMGCVAVGLAQKHRSSHVRPKFSQETPETKAYIYVGYNATMCKGFNGTFPVYGQCGAFYFCQNNYVYYDTCQAGLNYNHLNGRCDYPNNVDCTRRGFNWNGFPYVQRSKDATKVRETRSVAQTKAYQFVGYNATMCKGFNGTLPVAGQCGSFYFCQNNYVYFDVCQGAMNYNHLNGRCDYPYNVDCTRRGFNWNGFPFVQRGKQAVVKSETKKASASSMTFCDPSQMVMCFVNPCQFSKCANVAGAICHADYCRGCNARWFTSTSGTPTEVTNQCRQ